MRLLDPPVLTEEEWTARQAAHERRVDAWVEPHQQRRRAGQAHPVWDFLFTYYSQTPGRLRRWHPGLGVVLTGPAAEARLDWPFHTRVGPGVAVDVEAFLARRSTAVGWVHGLLSATAGRSAQFGCFGLHEWAMLYRPSAGEVRHEQLPVRRRCWCGTTQASIRCWCAAFRAVHSGSVRTVPVGWRSAGTRPG